MSFRGRGRGRGGRGSGRGRGGGFIPQKDQGPPETVVGMCLCFHKASQHVKLRSKRILSTIRVGSCPSFL